MALLSITFHSIESQISVWNEFVQNELISLIENLIEIEKFILSEVHSEMISEGKNTNLLLIFENKDARQQFLDIEMLNISERVEMKFGDQVMIFITELNSISKKI